MSDGVTDPLEKAVLSGAIFAGPDPDGPERQRTPDSDEESVDNDDHLAASAAGSSEPRQPVHTTKGASHNTGVKGVLADYRNRNQASTSATSAATSHIGKGFQGLAISKKSGQQGSRKNESDGQSSDGLSDDDRAAHEAYRRQRLEEMKKMGSGQREQASSQRTRYGHLREVGQSQFIAAVEDCYADSVIVHVFDASIPACKVLNTHLSTLARRYPYTKFLRAHARDLEFATGSEKDVLPTLLIYRQGDVFKNLVAFDKELLAECGYDDEDEDDDIGLSSRVTRDVIEQTLIRHQVLQPSAAVHTAESAGEDD